MRLDYFSPCTFNICNTTTQYVSNDTTKQSTITVAVYRRSWTIRIARTDRRGGGTQLSSPHRPSRHYWKSVLYFRGYAKNLCAPIFKQKN